MTDHPSLGAVLVYTRWALEHSDLSPNARAVALLVATYYNRRDGYARPSWAEIAKVLKITPRAVARCVAACNAAAIWHADTDPRRATRYRYPIGANVHTPDASVTPDMSTPLTPASPPPDASVTPPLTPASPELTTEHQLSEQGASKNGDGFRARAPWLVEGISAREWIERNEAALPDADTWEPETWPMTR